VWVPGVASRTTRDPRPHHPRLCTSPQRLSMTPTERGGLPESCPGHGPVACSDPFRRSRPDPDSPTAYHSNSCCRGGALAGPNTGTSADSPIASNTCCSCAPVAPTHRGPRRYRARTMSAVPTGTAHRVAPAGVTARRQSARWPARPRARRTPVPAPAGGLRPRRELAPPDARSRGPGRRHRANRCPQPSRAHTTRRGRVPRGRAGRRRGTVPCAPVRPTPAPAPPPRNHSSTSQALLDLGDDVPRLIAPPHRALQLSPPPRPARTLRR
jgi:hypothetical protein